jgi:hypothetical protein
MATQSRDGWLTRTGLRSVVLTVDRYGVGLRLPPSGGSDGPASMRRPRFRTLSRLALAGALVLPTILLGCAVLLLPEFPGGVRVTAVEQPVELPGVVVPVSNAEDIGVVIVTFGGSGTQQFDDFTNGLGLADHPAANADAEWQFVLKFETSNAPGCVDVGPITRNGDPTGLEFDVTCIVY